MHHEATRREQSVPDGSTVYAKSSHIGSQWRSWLSYLLTCLCAFPKTYSPFPVMAGTGINDSSWNTANDFGHVKNGGWDKLVKHCGHLGISKMFSEKWHFRTNWKWLFCGRRASSRGFEREQTNVLNPACAWHSQPAATLITHCLWQGWCGDESSKVCAAHGCHLSSCVL